jgi:Polyketide cyclase / dehydrase and lipid transport
VVFDFVADERNEPRYKPRLLRAEKTSDGPIGPGTQFRAQTTNMGRAVEMVIEITTYERPGRLASSTHLSAMDIDGILTFESVPGGTRMGWSWEVKPRGFSKLISPLIARMGQRQEKAIWTNLKHLLEGQHATADHA